MLMKTLTTKKGSESWLMSEQVSSQTIDAQLIESVSAKIAMIGGAICNRYHLSCKDVDDQSLCKQTGELVLALCFFGYGVQTWTSAMQNCGLSEGACAQATQVVMSFA